MTPEALPRALFPEIPALAFARKAEELGLEQGGTGGRPAAPRRVGTAGGEESPGPGKAEGRRQRPSTGRRGAGKGAQGGWPGGARARTFPDGGGRSREQGCEWEGSGRGGELG